MKKVELIALFGVTAGVGGLLGLGVGEFVRSVVRGAVLGALVGTLVAMVGMVFYVYFGNSTNPEDW
jgi:hypothetical protein